MFKQRTATRTARLIALALVSGGTLFSTCVSRFKDGAVDGTTNFLFSLLDPEAITDLLFDGEEDPGAEESSGGT